MGRLLPLRKTLDHGFERSETLARVLHRPYPTFGRPVVYREEPTGSLGSRSTRSLTNISPGSVASRPHLDRTDRANRYVPPREGLHRLGGDAAPLERVVSVGQGVPWGRESPWKKRVDRPGNRQSTTDSPMDQGLEVEPLHASLTPVSARCTEQHHGSRRRIRKEASPGRVKVTSGGAPSKTRRGSLGSSLEPSRGGTAGHGAPSRGSAPSRGGAWGTASGVERRCAREVPGPYEPTTSR
jgi:hypothetical protein